jgi:eukaryotic-like serine/threonine-protein kinase
MLLQTCDEFVKTLRKSALVADDRINSFLENHPQAGNPTDLAKSMIQAELITAFQAEQLLQGKTRGYDLGRYRILKKLGGGSTGIVFLGEHLVMKHRVAIKVLSNNHMQTEPTALARFRREARAASSLQHPNIVKTIDLDEDDGRHYLVMEYVEGTALDVIGKRQPVPITEVVNFMIQAMDGLQHIYTSGLVHRDLKPGNLLLDKQGVVKILDLGLARFIDDNRGDNITIQQGQMILGTLDFMAPEQADKSSEVDIRADIYSMGSTMYYMLCGQSPVPDGPMTSKIIALQFQTAKPIRQMRSEVDSELESIMNKMMAKEPKNRYQQPRECKEALQQWLEKRRGSQSGTTTTATYPVEPSRRINQTGTMPSLAATGTMQALKATGTLPKLGATAPMRALPSAGTAVMQPVRQVQPLPPVQNASRAQMQPTHVAQAQPVAMAQPLLQSIDEPMGGPSYRPREGNGPLLTILMCGMLVSLGAILAWFFLKG